MEVPLVLSPMFHCSQQWWLNNFSYSYKMAEWNIYCETEKRVISVWSTVNDSPQACPNDPSHIIDPNNNYIARLARLRFCNCTIVTTDSPTYVPLLNYITQGSHIAPYDNDHPLMIKIVSSVDSGSYDFSFVTVPDGVLLYESIGNTNTSPEILSIPITSFVNLPVNESTVDIRFRTSGGTVTVRNISIYYRVTPN